MEQDKSGQGTPVLRFIPQGEEKSGKWCSFWGSVASKKENDKRKQR